MREEVAGTGTEQSRFPSGNRRVASGCDAKCDAISGDRIEVLARAVVLVAGMNIPEAAREAVLARVVADLTNPRMSGNFELGRGLRRREKNANEAGAGRFEKPAPAARAAPSEAHESLISRKTVADVPLAGPLLRGLRLRIPRHPSTGPAR